MRKIAFLFLLLLSGCMSKEERMAAANAKDDQQCLSYGAQKGTDAYVNCRAQLEASRRQADAALSAASEASRPRNCINTGGYGGGTIICN
ncbi:hypothetical protein [Bradyrhizobium liaoningense]|uniref:hypothetical protein n=1 Tax=Bradyrhizobium liaoningense TaxID=43992 RepID=UPI001BAAA2D1|nr:hypothetical protein [Bradyrhizobium liaoningense]MBR1170556.1 hypothetical protein [Bradyrhizobium liaoningense]